MAETTRMRAIQNLANQLPVASRRVAAGQKAARDIQLQQAVARAPSTAPITETAQTTGAAAAQQAGQQAVEQAGRQVEQAGRIGQAGLAEQELATRGALAQQRLGVREEKMNNAQRLEALSQGSRRELIDGQMRLERDETGAVRLNTIQMADYVRKNARSNEQFKNYAQAVDIATKRSIQVWQHAYNVLEENLQQKYTIAKQRGDHKVAAEIASIRKAAAEQMQKKKNNAANSQAAWAAGGTVVGAVVGGYLGYQTTGDTAGGAMAGAGIGGALGSAVGSQQQ
jgi:hypothetical protein